MMYPSEPPEPYGIYSSDREARHALRQREPEQGVLHTECGQPGLPTARKTAGFTRTSGKARRSRRSSNWKEATPMCAHSRCADVTSIRRCAASTTASPVRLGA
jgi:hypothetical protein